MQRKLALFALVFFIGITPRGSVRDFAATRSASFSVTATVQTQCDVSAVVNFSNYAEAAVQAPRNVSVACSNAAPYYVQLTGGRAFGRYLVQPMAARFAESPIYAASAAGDGAIRSIEAPASLTTATADPLWGNNLVLTIAY